MSETGRGAGSTDSLLSEAKVAELLALEPGLRTNRVLHDLLLKPRLLGYWTFLEPLHRGTEVSDVVVVFEDTALLFEAKTRSVPRPADAGWLREKIGEAVDQLNARVDQLKAGGVALRNEWRGELRLDPETIQDYYGVIVLNASFEAFEWRELADEEFARARIPIQVYSLLDLAELLRLVDTAWDFIVHYELRASYGRDQRMLVGREEETFVEVVGAMDRLWGGPEPDPIEGRRQQNYWIERSNALLKTRLATPEGIEAWASSRLMDFACAPGEVPAPLDATGRPREDADHAMRIRAIGVVAAMSRNRRTEYGRRWLNAAREALAEGRPAYRSSHSPSRNQSYVLAAWPVGEDPVENELGAFAVREMVRHGTSSCFAVAASAAAVLETHRALEAMCRGEKVEVPEEDFVLSPTIALIEAG